jgi:hypothetical protein
MERGSKMALVSHRHRQTIGRPLFEITYPIALSEMLWGTSTFVYIIVFTRIGTDACLLAAQARDLATTALSIGPYVRIRVRSDRKVIGPDKSRPGLIV